MTANHDSHGERSDPYFDVQRNSINLTSFSAFTLIQLLPSNARQWSCFSPRMPDYCQVKNLVRTFGNWWLNFATLTVPPQTFPNITRSAVVEVEKVKLFRTMRTPSDAAMIKSAPRASRI